MGDIPEHQQLSSILLKSKTEQKNLREKAEEYEKESKRLHEKSKLLTRKIGPTRTQHQKQYFKTLWSLLSENYPGVTSVGLRAPGKPGYFSFPSGYGKQLGQALQQNTNVTSIGLSFSSLNPKNPKRKDVSKLIVFLEQSKSLREVELYDSTLLQEDADEIAFAIAANSNIERLVCVIDESISLASFHHFMTSSASSIQELVIGRCRSWETPTSEVDTIVSSFSKASGLTSLKLENGFKRGFIEPIVRQLQQTKSPLCELLLMDAAQLDLSVLSDFLHNTPSMRHFGLGSFAFDADSMEALLTGLKPQEDATTLCKLSLTCCEFNGEARDKLVQFMQTPTKSAGGDELYRSSLREMHFEDNRYEPFLDDEGKLLSSMLALPSADDAPLATIGSQFITLSLSSIRDPHVHMREIGQNAKTIGLSTVKLENIERRRFSQVFNDILKLPSIRDVSLIEVDNFYGQTIAGTNNSNHLMLESLRKNGNLHHFECQCSEGLSVFNEVETRLVHAYCERNKRLGALLGSDAVQPVSGGSQTTGMDNDALDSGGGAAVTSEMADRLLYPTLAGTAMQTPNNCPTALIKSLLVRDESMVPSASEVESKTRRGTKRSRSRPIAPSAMRPAEDTKPKAKGPSKNAPNKRRK